MSELKCSRHSVRLICSFHSSVNEILVRYYSKIFLLSSVFERLALILIFAEIPVIRHEYVPCPIPNINKVSVLLFLVLIFRLIN